MADKQNPNIQQNQQQPPQGYYVVNMSTAPYSPYPTTTSTQIPIYTNQVPQQQFYPVMAQPVPAPQPQPQLYYAPPQQNYYYDPAMTPSPVGYHAADPVPLLAGGHAKDRLKMREYEVNTNKWLGEAWNLFKEHWLVAVLFTALWIGVQFIPYVGSFIALPLAPGFFLAATHHLRGHEWNSWHLLHGIFLFFPLLVIGLLYSLLVAVGLFLCIIPGLYFAIAYSFSMYIYIEWRQEGVGIIDAMSVCRHLVAKNFWDITGFLIVQWLIILLGCLALGVGFFVAFPVVSLTFAFALRDMTGLSDKRTTEKSIICC